MNDHTSLHGIHVPLITPFDADGGVALDALESLAHRVLDDRAAGIVALGTTAESGMLEPDEKTAVLDVCERVCAERGRVLIVGAGGADTRKTVAEVWALRKRPEVTAALVPVPQYVRPGEAGVLAHFEQVAAHSPVPLIVYNIPYRTGQHVGTASMLRLAAMDRIIGVKHAVGGIDKDTVELLGRPTEDFAVLGGDDLYISPLLAMGAAGGILASAHLHTTGFADLADAWHKGDAAGARGLGHRLATVSRSLFREPSPTILKAVLHAKGRIPSPAVRLPLVQPTEEAVSAALEALEALDAAEGVVAAAVPRQGAL
ncbi:dihydrodipicolinate synthase family protein [Nocardiopsis sediminis]|uniref:Dihydrodipicolinate synthase family protein n=1 Tax=Nocardiopsis sediminis TaxID=1778267 RepID=A0ABV8FHT0_9ACTN